MKGKVSFDFDGTLSEDNVEEFAKQLINDGYEVWIVTSRPSDEDLTNTFQPWSKPNWNLDIWDTCERLNIPKEHVKFTSYVDKIEFLKGKGFIFHLDDDVDELVEIMNDIDEPCYPVNVNHSEWKKTCLDLLK